MNSIDALLASVNQNTPPVRCVVRLATSYWTDKRGLHLRQSITVLRKLSFGGWDITDDASMLGAEEIFPRITNLSECKDGLYEIVTCNEKRDWETGLIDDYDYRLLKFAT